MNLISIDFLIHVGQDVEKGGMWTAALEKICMDEGVTNAWKARMQKILAYRVDVPADAVEGWCRLHPCISPPASRKFDPPRPPHYRQDSERACGEGEEGESNVHLEVFTRRGHGRRVRMFTHESLCHLGGKYSHDGSGKCAWSSI